MVSSAEVRAPEFIPNTPEAGLATGVVLVVAGTVLTKAAVCGAAVAAVFSSMPVVTIGFTVLGLSTIVFAAYNKLELLSVIGSNDPKILPELTL